MRRWSRWHHVCMALLAAVVPGVTVGWVGQARAQVDAVALKAPRAFVGLGGVVRPGTWTPLRLTVRQRGSSSRAVICRWLLTDDDGDHPFMQRRITLNPNRSQSVWLYGNPPLSTDPRTVWTVQVLDAESQQLLTSKKVKPPTLVQPRVGAIGVMGSSPLGLEPYTKQYTEQELVGTVRGLKLTTLPDRWYGLSLAQSLIWTRDGGDPNDAAITAAMQQALRQWVRRGGHLVIVLPAFAQPWTGSPLADLLPVPAGMMRRVQARPPKFLYDVRPEEAASVEMTVFDHAQAAGLRVLETTDGGDPVVVTKRYGFGELTVVGVDLADPRIKQLNIPSGRFTIWNRIFDWQSPAISDQVARLQIHQGHMSRPGDRSLIPLGQFIPALVAMTSTAAPPLFAAIVVFVLYWLAAGPLGFVLLRRKGRLRKSWLVFLAVVGLFTAVAWGGAYFLRPGRARIAHFTVLDADGRSGEVHAHSWLSLFMPHFGRTHVQIDPAHKNNHDTLASPGLLNRQKQTGFLDTLSYTINAAMPNEAKIPMRATAKQLVVDFHGSNLADDTPGLQGHWVMPQGALHVDATTGFPKGELQHDLPGALENVLVVFCPGGGPNPTPWVWRLKKPWPPETVLKLDSPARMGLPADRLVIQQNYDKPRVWNDEGFLGSLIGTRTGLMLTRAANPLQVSVASDQRVKLIEMLSFYSALPPPDYHATNFANPAASYQRGLGRSLDLTPLTRGRRVILIGHLARSPLPLPLTADGQAVPSDGWTVVRWIYDLR